MRITVGERVRYIDSGFKQYMQGTVVRADIASIEVLFDTHPKFGIHRNKEKGLRAHTYKIQSIKGYGDASRKKYIEILNPKKDESTHMADATSYVATDVADVDARRQERYKEYLARNNTTQFINKEEIKMDPTINARASFAVDGACKPQEINLEDVLGFEPTKFALVVGSEGKALYRFAGGKKALKLANKVAANLAAEAKGTRGIFYVMQVVSAHQVEQRPVVETSFGED